LYSPIRDIRLRDQVILELTVFSGIRPLLDDPMVKLTPVVDNRIGKKSIEELFIVNFFPFPRYQRERDAVVSFLFRTRADLGVVLGDRSTRKQVLE